MKRQRRALNIVWTAAGEYGFQPSFLAFYRDGSPDIYLNSVVGFAHRFYAVDELTAYLRTLDDSLMRDVFTDIFWLGVEHAVYQRGTAERPVLQNLRAEHARRFLLDEVDVSMQQLMMRSNLVHTLAAGRCREVLTGRSGIRNPWERRLYEALCYPGSCETQELIARTQHILRRFFVFHFTDVRHGPWHISLGSWLNAWLRRVLPVEYRRMEERVLSRQSVADGGSGQSFPLLPVGRLHWGRTPRQIRQELDRQFGEPLFGEEKHRLLEQEYCWGNHRQARLYFVRARRDSRVAAANRAFFRAHERSYALCIRLLRERWQDCLAVHRQPVPIRSRTGQLSAGTVWRGLILDDPRLFTTQSSQIWTGFDVTLLLDGSASREDQQALIAAQAYVLAQSLVSCEIPVQVLSFASLHGFTVLRQLKAFTESDCQTIFDYFALGWNRDGLALRSIPALFRQESGRRQLLLVLTDAHPSDDLGLPRSGVGVARNYMDEPAIDDAAAEAKRLRGGGVRLIGLINSVVREAAVSSAARRIYGQECARIEDENHLAVTVGALVERQIGLGME